MSPVRQAREPFGTIADRVSARDRGFFDDHPGEPAYLRRYIPGEFPSEALAAADCDAPKARSWVMVTALAPGIRVRRPIGRVVGRPKDGRITLVFPDGAVVPDVPVVGWRGRR
jgi:hypothetical protein